MNYYRNSFVFIALSSALLLAACNQKADTSVVAPSASEVAAASAAANTELQTLSSDDGVISLNVSGHFEDKSADASQYIDDAGSNKPSLLRYDADNDITIYINNFGTPKQAADVYFAKLAESIQSDKGLENIVVDTPADQRMGYRFSHGENDNALNESCIAVYAANLYNICATSNTASIADLDALLRNLTVKQ